FGFQIDVDTQRTDLFDQYVEGFRHTRLHAVIAVHDVLVHLGPTVHIVRLDGQHFLQGVGGTVGFQCPDLHLPETLTTELRFTTQRLLGNQAVGTGGTRMHLVVDQVVQLQHVHVADGSGALELVAGTPIEQLHLAAFRQIGQFQHGLDLALLGTVEHRGGHRHALAQVVGQVQHFLIVQVVQAFLATTDLVVDLVQELAQIGDLALLFEHQVDLLAQPLGRQAQVGFEDLPDVHPRGYAQRVEHDVHRRAVGIMGHVFDRHDHRYHTLVTVATGHLVARLDATLDRQVHLDDLQYARCQVIALLQLALLVFGLVVAHLATIADVGLGLFQLLVQSILGHAQLEPLATLQTVEVLVGDHGAFLQTGTAFGLGTDQSGTQTFEGGTFDDAELFVEVLADLVECLLLDGQGAAVAVHAVTGEGLHVDYGALGAGRHAQGGVLHIGCLLTEDRTQQLLFRSQLGLAFRGD